MKKLKIHRTFQLLFLSLAIILLVASCGPSYVRVDSRRPYPYRYGYSYPRYRYVVPPPRRVIVVPRNAPPKYRHDNGRHNGRRGRY
ncbi:hypothetical protein ABID42_003627 [Arcicella rosea]|uniref:hypothetical protein n=1 Tax=Arcicella rosea TaxID=502909 RepID=UPI00345E063E